MKKLFIYPLLLALLSPVFPTANAVTTDEVHVPIIMYHSLAGRIGTSSIAADDFEADLQYLRDMGYTAVTIRALVDFVDHGTPLPEKPIVLTFDDGYYNNYSAAFPLVLKYNTPIVISIIGKDSEIWSAAEKQDERHGHLSWSHTREMADTGLVEFANHTWDMHKIEHGRKGVNMRPGEDRTTYRQQLREDLETLQTQLLKHCGVQTITFTYPFGNLCPEASIVLAEMGFRATLSCRDGVNVLRRGDPDALYNMRRYERTPQRSLQAILDSH